MRATRFEDLVAWQKARELSREVYRLTGRGPFRADRSLVWQMRSASNSIMANLAEGFDRHGAAEFHRHVCIANASCSELRSHMYVALDNGYLAPEEFDGLRDRAAYESVLLRKLRASLERAPAKER